MLLPPAAPSLLLAKQREARTEACGLSEIPRFRYKAFLDSVTPVEWFEALAAAAASRKAQLRHAWEAACAEIAEQKAAAAAAKQRAEHDMQWARTQQQYERAERAHREAAAQLREALAIQVRQLHGVQGLRRGELAIEFDTLSKGCSIQSDAALPHASQRLWQAITTPLLNSSMQDPPEPEYAAADAVDAGMHFKGPSQLLALFSQLEGSNMIQIQTTQEAEAALESARSAAEAAEAAAAAEAASLSRQVAELEAAIGAARERCTQLRATAAANGAAQDKSCAGQQAEAAPPGSGKALGAAVSNGLSLSAALLERLEAAYEAAGFARDASATPLQMLQKVEGRLEELLAAVGPPGSPGALAAEAVERAREKERRQAARAVKLAEKRAEHVGLLDTCPPKLERAADCLPYAPCRAFPAGAHGCYWPPPPHTHTPLLCCAGVAGGPRAGPRRRPKVPKDGQARHGAQRAAA